MAKMIKLVSSDGREFEVEKEVSFQSKVIKDLLADSDSDSDVIPLPMVSSKVLIQVIEYCRKHAAVNFFPLSPSSSSSSSSYSISSKPVSDPALSAWDEEFVKLDPSSLYDLLVAANYLDIEGLVNLICETIANMIRRKQPEEIRQLLDIENDFTPEQEKAIRSKNSWVFKE